MAAGEEQSREYLRRHRLPELLQRLGALLLFHRPERPREFLIQVLERVKAGRRAEGEYPFLMDEANVDAMFSLLDVLGQGHIRPAQYREALKTLGLSTEDLELEDDVNITLDVFKEGMGGTTAGDEIGSEFKSFLIVKEEKDAGELVCVLV